MVPNNEFQVIKAGIEELDLVVGLFNKYRIFYKQPSDEKGCKSFIQERMENQQSVIYLAIKNHTPLGFVQLYPSFSSVAMKKLWILNDLYVDQTARRMGIATATAKG